MTQMGLKKGFMMRPICVNCVICNLYSCRISLHFHVFEELKVGPRPK
jgi:hypothetical protein